MFRDFCQIIVRKGAISFVSSLSQCFSSSVPATFEEFKFNSKLTTPLHFICYGYIWHFREFRQVSVKLYIKLYLLTMLLTGDELIRKVDVNLIITWFVFKLNTI
jgi:hypothetical protein